MVAPLVAAKAYAAVQAAATPALAGDGAVAAGPDFGQMVTSAINQATSATRTAEAQMTAGVQGKSNLVDVVTAISSAETSLDTVLAIRDQVISAYQEIMRTNI
jgi:flagellar hook-basal body complex protein FliE